MVVGTTIWVSNNLNIIFIELAIPKWKNCQLKINRTNNIRYAIAL